MVALEVHLAVYTDRLRPSQEDVGFEEGVELQDGLWLIDEHPDRLSEDQRNGRKRRLQAVFI